MAGFTHSTIQNCTFNECPSRFVELTATDDPAIRMCSQCERPVYSCGSMNELKSHVSKGRCVSLRLERCEPSELTHGDVVEITTGPFQGFQGIIMDVNVDEQTASIALEIFGPGPREMSLDSFGVVRED